MSDIIRVNTSNVYAKWGEAAQAGFQAVPDLLLTKQKKLKLGNVELIVLLNVLMHWWYADTKPFPRPTIIADRMGISVRTVQRAFITLQGLGLIVRTSDRNRKVIDPSGLVKKLSEYAKTDVHYLKRVKSAEERAKLLIEEK